MNKERKRLAVAFTGPSNSGKTTLIIKISNILQDSGYKVAIIKHHPKNKAIFDTDGKDSYKFSQTGADVAVLSPNNTTIFKKKALDIDRVIDMFDDFDFLLVEGLKTLPLPRICIMRNNIDERYFNVSDIIATDDSIDKNKLLNKMSTLDLNNPENIIKWIQQNAKKV